MIALEIWTIAKELMDLNGIKWRKVNRELIIEAPYKGEWLLSKELIDDDINSRSWPHLYEI